MSTFSQLLLLLLAALGLYVAGVALVVTGGLLLCRFLARHDRMDEAQARVFGAYRPSWALRVLGHVVEVLVAAFDLALRFLWLLRVLPAPSDPGSGTPIVLLPGFTENAGAMWWFARRLRQRGFRPFLVDFPSTFHSIERNVAFLRLRLAALQLQTGCERIAIVAHSMGGVVARALLLSDADHCVLSLVAIAAPFRGTHMARIGAQLGFGHSTIDLCPNSAFVGKYLPSAAAQVPIHVIVGEQENIVAPPWSCVLPGCDAHVLSLPVGHDAPLHLPEAFARLEAWLLEDGVLRSDAAVEQVTEPG